MALFTFSPRKIKLLYSYGRSLDLCPVTIQEFLNIKFLFLCLFQMVSGRIPGKQVTNVDLFIHIN